LKERNELIKTEKDKIDEKYKDNNVVLQEE
jgi:hypothetical protein